MAEFGQTGKWIFVPVKLVIAFLGAYYIFSGGFSLGNMIISGVPMVINPNGVGHIFGTHPDAAFMERFYESISYPVIGWMVQLYKLQLVITCIGGFFSLCALLCSLPLIAKLLYYTSISYGFAYFATHLGMLYCHQKQYLLDFIPAYRGSDEHQVLIFGELTWPSSFWYNYATQLLLTVYMVYSVSDLYYSWYLILKSGGSGWEMLPAEELPGWEKYQAKLEAKERAKYGGGADEEQGPSVEELQRLMMQMQRNQGAGGQPRFGEVPPRMGIPIRD